MIEQSPTEIVSRRKVLRTGAAVGGALTLGSGVIGTVTAHEDNFPIRVHGEGDLWASKATTKLPKPENKGSLDKLFVIPNSNNPAKQFPVGEAAPGSPNNFTYNGGRWWTHTAEWTQAGFDAHGTVPILTRYGPADDPESVLFHLNLGHLEITEGAQGKPDFFECPLVRTHDHR